MLEGKALHQRESEMEREREGGRRETGVVPAKVYFTQGYPCKQCSSPQQQKAL